MSLPKINLNDGKHRMVIAEEGERVLTPEQNRSYEAQHPDARKEPMHAEVYDMGGYLGKVKQNLASPEFAASYEQVPVKAETTPALNQIPMYDDGGLVGKINNRAKEIYSDMKKYPATVQEPMRGIAATGKNVEEYNAAQRPAMKQPYAPTTSAPADRMNPAAKYGDRPGEQRIPDAELKNMTNPLYDDGGVVESEDDEKKAAAMRQAETEVQAEERGRTPDQVTVDIGGAKAIPNPKGIKPQMDTDAPEMHPDKPVGTKMSTDNAPLGPPKMNIDNTPLPGEGGITEPVPASIKAPRPTKMNYTPAASEPAAEKSPDPMDLIQQDKLEAMKKGTAGLSDLGTSLIHERLMKGELENPALAPTETSVMPQYTGKERIGKGTPGEAEAHKQFEDKRQDYDKRIQAAMDQGTPEGDREAASLQLAKSHFERMNPFGSAANRPGIMGKLGHIASRIGEGALDVYAGPEATATLIPGSPEGRRMREEEFRGQEEKATKESLEQAQAKQALIGSKLPPPTQVFDDLKNQINPETGKIYTDPERLDIAQNPGKAAEVTYARKYMKDHPGSNYEDGAADYHRMVAGTKPLNEQERQIADYLAANKMEDTPPNRDVARQKLLERNNLIKQQVDLPFSEAKAKFNDSLSTNRALLVQQNADANQRGLKADELQQVENARSSAVSSKLTTAKDALSATDEQFSNQIVPIVTLLSVTSAEGVKRVNKQELDKFVPTSGSFGRWVEGHSDQFLSGQIPAEYRAEVGHMLDRMTAAEVAEHLINTRSIDETIRQGAQTPVQKPGGGAKATPAPSKPQAPAASKPAGGTTGGFADWKKKQEQK